MKYARYIPFIFYLYFIFLLEEIYWGKINYFLCSIGITALYGLVTSIIFLFFYLLSILSIFVFKINIKNIEKYIHIIFILAITMYAILRILYVNKDMADHIYFP